MLILERSPCRNPIPSGVGKAGQNSVNSLNREESPPFHGGVLQTSNQFRKDQKKAIKQHKNFKNLQEVIRLLLNEITLPEKYCDHPLAGEWKGARDCHVENDWVLIYQIDKKKKTLRLIRLGSHSELFR